MNVRAVVSAGNFTAEAHVEDCGPDALDDAMRQVITASLALCGDAAIKAAALEVPDGDDD